jgi:hypothetical protein
MIGVAPPSLGANVAKPEPSAAPAPAAPAPVPAPHEFGAPQGFGGGTQPNPAYGATQQGFGSPAAGYPGASGYGNPSAQPPQQAPSGVNPLGGTVVADASSFSNPNYGHAPGQSGGYEAAPPPQGGYGGPPPDAGAPPPGYGAPQGGYGGPPQGYGAPPAGGGFGSAPTQGFGATEPAGSAYQQQMQPYAPLPPLEQGRDSNMVIPGTVGGPNSIVTVLLIVATCGIYGIYLLVKGKKSAQQ